MPGEQVAWGDYNNDSWVDFSGDGTIYRNTGGSSFASTGYNAGNDAIWGDFDNDGFLDLFNYAGKTLYRGVNGTSFVNESSKLPSLPTSISRGAVWADLNNDAFIDLYVGGYEVWQPTTYPDFILTYNPTAQQYSLPWQETVYRARGVTAADFDRDGDQDVYVSNYRLQPNRLWQNDGSGNMTDVAHSLGVAGTNNGGYYGHTIGSAWGDFDNDGYLDLFVGNFSHAAAWQDRAKLYRNLGPSGGYHFQLMKTFDNADWQESYASPALADYDNDGDLDIYFTTVYPGDYPRMYRNNGNWSFTNVTGSVGLGGIGSTYQAAWADVDNDGDLDLATAGRLFVNNSQANGNHWLKIHLEGDGENVNSAAIGAQVRVHAGTQMITRQVEAGTGEGNQNDLTMHFGLGSHDDPVDVEILWPDGTLETITSVDTNQLFQWKWGEIDAEVFIGPGSDWSVDENWLGGTSPGNGATIPKLHIQNGSTVNFTMTQGITEIAGEQSEFCVGRPDKGGGTMNVTGGILYINSEADTIIGVATDTTTSIGLLSVSGQGGFLGKAPVRLGDGTGASGFLGVSEDGQAVIQNALILGSNSGAGYVALSGNGSLSVDDLDVSQGYVSFTSESDASLTMTSKNQLYFEQMVATGKIRVQGAVVSDPFETVFWVDRDTLSLASSYHEGFVGSGSDWNDDANWVDGTSPGSDATLDDVLHVMKGSTANHTAAQGTTTITGRFRLGRPDHGGGTVNLSGGTLHVNSLEEVIIGTADGTASGNGMLNISGSGQFVANGKVTLGSGVGSFGVIDISEDGVAGILADLAFGESGGIGFVILSEGGSLTTADLLFTSGWLSFVEASDASLTVLDKDQAYFQSLVADQWIRIDNAAVTGAFADYFQVDGSTLSLLIQLLVGDLDGDGFVGGSDLDIIRSFWGQAVTPGNLLHGDPSGDGFVGGDDLDILRAHWGEGTPPGAAPEPSTWIGLLGLLTASLMLGRSCRRSPAYTSV